jgi:hypothetical protein
MRQGKMYFFAAVVAFLFFMRLGSGPAWGAIGCDLNDPDREVKRFFPGSTGYKTVTLEVAKVGGQQLLNRIQERLRDKLHGLYEMIDVPYTRYEIYAKKKKIGYIHGVDQKGRYGAIEIFLVLDLNERIKAFYIQKMSGEYAGKFRDAEFAKQFVGLTLADFDQYNVITGKRTGTVSEIKNPVPEAEQEFKYIMRGTKKNLILVNELIPLSPVLSSKKGAPAK